MGAGTNLHTNGRVGNYIMNRLIIFFVLISLAACSASRQPEIGKVIEINSDAQYFQQNALQYLGNRMKMVDKGDYRMYIGIRRTLHTEDRFDDRKQEMNSTVTKIDTSYMYFVYRKGTKEGLVYNRRTGDSLKGIPFHIDTLIKSVGLDSNNLSGLGNDLGEPLHIIKDKTRLLEKYVLKRVNSETPDSIYRYYDTGYKNVEFTFSKALDQKHNSKLVRVQSIYNPTETNINGKMVRIPRMEWNWELAYIDFPKKLIDKYFSLFEADSRRNGAP